MDVTRYEGNDGSYLDHGTMYVLAKDFDALLAQRDALQGKLQVAVNRMLDAKLELADDCPISAERCLDEALAQIEGK